MGVDFGSFFRGGDERVVSVSQQFGGAMAKVDEEIRKLMVCGSNDNTDNECDNSHIRT